MKRFKRYLIYIVLFALVLCAFIYLGKQDYQQQSEPSEKISKLYSEVPDTNLFQEVDASKVSEFLTAGSGYLVIGYPSNLWMQKWMEEIYLAANACGVETIYYYDSLQDSKYNTKEYQAILEKLSSYTKQMDFNTNYLLTPVLMKVEEGVITYYNDETAYLPSEVTVEDYWDEDQKQNFLIDLYQVMHEEEEVTNEEN